MGLLSQLFGVSLLFIASGQTHNFTMEDLLDYKCKNGNETACMELKQLQLEKEQAQFMDERIAAYGPELEKLGLMLDKRRPDLAAAYPLVMNDYFQALNDTGDHEKLTSVAQLEECASHYHNHWINKKLWWPNDEGKPNWEDIYVFIVDHYYGYCLKKF